VIRVACVLVLLLCWPGAAALGQAQTAGDKPASTAAEPAASRGKQSRAQQRRAQRAQRKRDKSSRARAGRDAASERKQAAAEAATPAAQAPATPASEESAASAPAASSTPAPSRGAQPPAAPAAAAADDVRVEGDTQVKVMEFSGLDIEGQLKTPQMLYFLNRMRAEFGRPRLPHRSFMPELQRGTRSKAF
jgi:hypothetical protein